VNQGLARAVVGLCLSTVEGSNYASMEYMLAGLPIVSTPSIGGREVYFDP
jgi:glycosyltransferase involved in cell wall biosynthesis